MFRKFIVLAVAILSVSAQLKFLENTNENIFSKIKLQLANPVADNVIAALDGFFSTVGLYAEMPSIAKCKDYDFKVINEAIDIVEDIAGGQIAKLATDIYELGKAAWNIYNNCSFKQFKPELDKAWSDVKANFSQQGYIQKVIKGVETNMFAILAQGQTLYNDINSKNFRHFGETLGSLLRLVLIPQ
jgi:hypothetical protein